MKKLLIAIFAGLFIASIVFGANNLYEHYDGNLPPIELRGAPECGIEGYTGTAEQNMRLLACLERREVVGRPIGEPEPFFEVKHFSFQHSFDAGIATHGIVRLSHLGALTVTTGTFSSTLDVDGNSTLDKVTVAENLEADGGLIVGGRKSYGEKASFSLTASDICDNNVITLIAYSGDADADEVGVSLSFPDDETLVAECMATAGDGKTFVIDNTASLATAYIDFVETGFVIGYSSTQHTDFAGDKLIFGRATNVDGSSISWEINVIDASVSFQP